MGYDAPLLLTIAFRVLFASAAAVALFGETFDRKRRFPLTMIGRIALMLMLLSAVVEAYRQRAVEIANDQYQNTLLAELKAANTDRADLRLQLTKLQSENTSLTVAASNAEKGITELTAVAHGHTYPTSDLKETPGWISQHLHLPEDVKWYEKPVLAGDLFETNHGPQIPRLRVRRGQALILHLVDIDKDATLDDRVATLSVSGRGHFIRDHLTLLRPRIVGEESLVELHAPETTAGRIQVFDNPLIAEIHFLLQGIGDRYLPGRPNGLRSRGEYYDLDERGGQ